jgi:hypothetical protein
MKDTTILDWNKVFSGDVEPLDFVFGGFLAGSVGGIIAPGGAGKSYLGLGLCISLTCKDLLGLEIEAKDHQVAYITAEDPLPVLYHRALSLSEHLSPEDREKVQSRVVLQSLHGFTPQLLTAKGERDERWIEGLKRAATGKRMMIIDTLRKFHQGEENDSGHMTLLTQILDEIASQTGCGVLFLHHANKGATLNAQGAEQGASRGSSALVDNIRFQLNLVSMSEAEAKEKRVDEACRRHFVRLVGSKSNYAENSGDHWLRRDKGGVLVKAHFDAPDVVERAKRKPWSSGFSTQFSHLVDDEVSQ